MNTVSKYDPLIGALYLLDWPEARAAEQALRKLDAACQVKEAVYALRWDVRQADPLAVPDIDRLCRRAKRERDKARATFEACLPALQFQLLQHPRIGSTVSQLLPDCLAD